MVKKINVGLVYGGKSAEHEVSLLSANSIRKNLDGKKYKCIDIFVDKNGKFALPKIKIDVFFPIIHGTFGEDGRLQGYFETLQIPYIGAGVLGSAIGIDKDVQKRLLSYSNIKTAKYILLTKNQKYSVNKVGKKIKFPLFVKPNSLGSSVGVTKVDNINNLEKAINKAFKFDDKILIEEYINGREIEVAVMGDNLNPIVSVVGEVIPSKKHLFYDYNAKYNKSSNTKLIIPADLNPLLSNRIRRIAKKTYQILNCYGFSRVDMFLTNDNKIIVNEINTIPGFTNVSMFPKLFEASGISYPEILDKLIDLSFKRHKQGLKLNYCR